MKFKISDLFTPPVCLTWNWNPSRIHWHC